MTSAAVARAAHAHADPFPRSPGPDRQCAGALAAGAPVKRGIQ